MATYNGRRAPNVSQYLANLNAVPSSQEFLAQDELNLGDDGLDFLTNTQFFDFDEFNDSNAFAADGQDGLAQQDPSADQPYQFANIQSFPSGVTSPVGTDSPPNSSHIAHFPQHPGAHFVQSPATGEKRKADTAALPAAADLEEASRMVAEEDKRRRNTAASARFRVKKKQREQALEKQSKEMSEKVQMLEGKVQQLEMENKWLKELITEKGDVKTVDASLLEKKSAAAAVAAAKAASVATAGGRKTGSHTDGVGTADDDDADSVKSED